LKARWKAQIAKFKNFTKLFVQALAKLSLKKNKFPTNKKKPLKYPILDQK